MASTATPLRPARFTESWTDVDALLAEPIPPALAALPLTVWSAEGKGHSQQYCQGYIKDPVQVQVPLAAWGKAIDCERCRNKGQLLSVRMYRIDAPGRVAQAASRLVSALGEGQRLLARLHDPRRPKVALDRVTRLARERDQVRQVLAVHAALAAPAVDASVLTWFADRLDELTVMVDEAKGLIGGGDHLAKVFAKIRRASLPSTWKGALPPVDETPVLVGLSPHRSRSSLFDLLVTATKVHADRDRVVMVMPRFAYEYVLRTTSGGRSARFLLQGVALPEDQDPAALAATAAALWAPQDEDSPLRDLNAALHAAQIV